VAVGFNRSCFGARPADDRSQIAIKAWLEKNKWNSFGEMRGNMSLARVPDPAAYQRENFRMMFGSHAVPS
jgi:hypothetical protein